MVSTVATIVVLAITVGLSESHKDGVHLPASIEEKELFGMPEDAIIIADLNSLRLEVAYTEEAVERLCSSVDSARRCLNATDDEPIYHGSDCNGKQCHMHPIGDPTCLTNMTDLRLDLHNASRALTCGLDPDDDAVIHPEIPNLGPPTSNAEKHIVGLPKGIDVHIWHVCVRGQYHDVIRITFSDLPALRYDCKEYPLCVGGNVHARGFCYTTPEYLVENTNSGQQMHRMWCWLILVPLLYLLAFV